MTRRMTMETDQRRCLECGYDLRGLIDTRRCPECRSHAVMKEGRHRYVCSDCEHHFSGMRIGVIRVAR